MQRFSDTGLLYPSRDGTSINLFKVNYSLAFFMAVAKDPTSRLNGTETRQKINSQWFFFNQIYIMHIEIVCISQIFNTRPLKAEKCKKSKTGWRISRCWTWRRLFMFKSSSRELQHGSYIIFSLPIHLFPNNINISSSSYKQKEFLHPRYVSGI